MECTNVGCIDGVAVELRGFQLGSTYDITITTADQSITCTLDARTQSLDTVSGSCTSPIDVRVGDTPSIFLESTPESMTIEVQRDATLVADMEVSPDYDKLAPNGESCGPVCDNASVQVDL